MNALNKPNAYTTLCSVCNHTLLSCTCDDGPTPPKTEPGKPDGVSVCPLCGSEYPTPCQS